MDVIILSEVNSYGGKQFYTGICNKISKLKLG